MRKANGRGRWKEGRRGMKGVRGGVVGGALTFTT